VASGVRSKTLHKRLTCVILKKDIFSNAEVVSILRICHLIYPFLSLQEQLTIFSNYFCKICYYKVNTTTREEKNLAMMWQRQFKYLFVFVVAQQSNVFWHRILFNVAFSWTDWWNLLKVWMKERSLHGQNPTWFSWNMKQELLTTQRQRSAVKIGLVRCVFAWHLTVTYGPNPCYRSAKKRDPI
jgi:hypothetical protein